MTLIVLYHLLKKETWQAAFWFGLVVHFKIYPVIFALPMYFYIDTEKKRFFTKNRLIFAIFSFAVFLMTTFYFYHIYGYECLYESLLYHLIRKDNRHNFSVYFYFIYLTYTNISGIYSVLAFVP